MNLDQSILAEIVSEPLASFSRPAFRKTVKAADVVLSIDQNGAIQAVHGANFLKEVAARPDEWDRFKLVIVTIDSSCGEQDCVRAFVGKLKGFSCSSAITFGELLNAIKVK